MFRHDRRGMDVAEAEHSGSSPRRTFGLFLGAVVLAGLLVNAYLAVVARALPDTADYAHFGAFWSVALLIGFGVFFPIEQELARLLQHAVTPAAVLRAAARTSGLLVGASAVVLAALLPVLRRAFGGDASLTWAAVAIVVVSGLQFVVRGMLIGLGRLDLHAAVLVLDALLRIVLAGVVLLGVAQPSAGWLAWSLPVAILLAHLAPLPWLRGTLRGARDRTAPDAGIDRSLRAAVGHLLIASLCAQTMQNGPALLVTATASAAERADAGVFLAAFTLARIPLFLAVPAQSAVVPALVRLATAGSAAFRRSVLLGSGMLLAVSALGGLGGSWLGVPVLRLVFGGRYEVQGQDLGLMVAAVLAHLGLLLVGQALLAGGQHARVALTWGTGLLVATVVAAVVPGLFLRAELALLVGSLAGWAAGVAFLVRRPSVVLPSS